MSSFPPSTSSPISPWPSWTSWPPGSEAVVVPTAEAFARFAQRMSDDPVTLMVNLGLEGLQLAADGIHDAANAAANAAAALSAALDKAAEAIAAAGESAAAVVEYLGSATFAAAVLTRLDGIVSHRPIPTTRTSARRSRSGGFCSSPSPMRSVTRSGAAPTPLRWSPSSRRRSPAWWQTDWRGSLTSPTFRCGRPSPARSSTRISRGSAPR